MEEKRFNEWNKLKKKLHDIGRLPAIKEGEVWWAAICQARVMSTSRLYKKMGQISVKDFEDIRFGFHNLY